MCSLTPSVTLYGTTQVPTVRTLTHTLTTTSLGEPQTTEITVTTTQCDIIGAQCGETVVNVPTTVIPVFTITTTSVEVKSTIATNVVPQQTLYYPCLFSETAQNGETLGLAEISAAGPTQAPTFETPEPRPQPTPTSTDTAYTEDVSASPVVVTSHLSSFTPISLQASSESESVSSWREGSLSSGRIRAATSNTALASPTPSARSSNGAAIGGGIAGGVIALIVVCVIMTYLRRARASSSAASKRHSNGTVVTDYLERRFRALEAEGVEQVDHNDDYTEKSNDEYNIGGKKIRLTLDLLSKDMPDRPPPRLSTISSFFGISPAPSSRHWLSSKSSDDRLRTGRRRTSRTSTSTTKTGKTSMKSQDVKDSAMVFSPVPPPTYRDQEAEHDDEPQERTVMEWIRPLTMMEDDVDECEGPSPPSFRPRHDLEIASAGKVRRHTPPRMPTLAQLGQSPINDNESSQECSTSSWSEASSGSARPTTHILLHMKATRSTSDAIYNRTTHVTSYHSARAAKGKTAPTLPLNRDAITPSLWIDEETYDEFRRMEQSRFSSDSSGVDTTKTRSTIEGDA